MIASSKKDLANRSPDAAVAQKLARRLVFMYGLFRRSHPLKRYRMPMGERILPLVRSDRVSWNTKERTARNRKRQGIAPAARKQLPQRHMRNLRQDYNCARA